MVDSPALLLEMLFCRPSILKVDCMRIRQYLNIVLSLRMIRTLSTLEITVCRSTQEILVSCK